MIKSLLALVLIFAMVLSVPSLYLADSKEHQFALKNNEYVLVGNNLVRLRNFDEYIWAVSVGINGAFEIETPYGILEAPAMLHLGETYIDLEARDVESLMEKLFAVIESLGWDTDRFETRITVEAVARLRISFENLGLAESHFQDYFWENYYAEVMKLIGLAIGAVDIFWYCIMLTESGGYPLC